MYSAYFAPSHYIRLAYRTVSAKNVYKLCDEGEKWNWPFELTGRRAFECSRWVFRKYAVYILCDIHGRSARAHTYAYIHDLTPFVTISSHVHGNGFTLGRRRDLYCYTLRAALHYTHWPAGHDPEGIKGITRARWRPGERIWKREKYIYTHAHAHA